MNMFKFGTNNTDLVGLLLLYLEARQDCGLCEWLDCVDSDAFLVWFECQEPFEQEGDETFPIEFPIEFALYPGREKWYIYRSTENKIDVSLPQGRLRRWWCYNLAIAVSQHPEFE